MTIIERLYSEYEAFVARASFTNALPTNPDTPGTAKLPNDSGIPLPLRHDVAVFVMNDLIFKSSLISSLLAMVKIKEGSTRKEF